MWPPNKAKADGKVIDTLEASIQTLVNQRGWTVDSAFFLGSLTAGLGTPRSDLDCYLLIEDDFDGTVWVNVDGCRIDFDVHPTSWVRRTLSEAFPLSGGHSNATVGFPEARSRAHFDTVGRLYYAIPIIEGAAWHEIDRFIRKHELDFRRYFVSQTVMGLAGLAEDAIGFRENLDGRSELLATYTVLLKAANAFLVSSGSLYLGEKWVARRLEQYLGDAFISQLESRYESIELREDRISYLWTLAQKFNLLAVTLGWDDALDVTLAQTILGGTPIGLPVGLTFARFADRVLVVRPGQPPKRIHPRLAIILSASRFQEYDAVANLLPHALSSEEFERGQEALRKARVLP